MIDSFKLTPEDMEEAYIAGMKAGRKVERHNCWAAINKWIRTGDLPGNGCDETAQRNGMVLAANLIQATSRKPSE